MMENKLSLDNSLDDFEVQTLPKKRKVLSEIDVNVGGLEKSKRSSSVKKHGSVLVKQKRWADFSVS